MVTPHPDFGEITEHNVKQVKQSKTPVLLRDITQKEFEVLAKDNPEDNQVVQELSEGENRIPIESKDSIEKGEISYFSTPNEDGSRIDAYKSKTIIEGGSFYKFRIVNEDTAFVSFLDEDEAAFKTVIDNAPSFLNPVCKVVEGSSRGAEKIQTVEEGVAYKDDKKRRIGKDKPVKIKYVS